jgi:ribosomal protein S12 methylthiotransferase
MQLQQRISLARNHTFVGQTLDVLVEHSEHGVSEGRSYRDAPEIDGLVLMDSPAPVGEIVPAHITGALEYDLTGSIRTGEEQTIPLEPIGWRSDG